MIDSIAIKGFRGVKEGRLSGLTPLVVIVGPNGSGKSAILDALLIGAHPWPVEAIGIVMSFRFNRLAAPRWLFWRPENSSKIEIEVNSSDSAKRIFQLASDGPIISEAINCRLDVQSSPSMRAGSSVGTLSWSGVNIQQQLNFPISTIPEVLMVASWLRQHQEPLHDVYSRAVVKGRGKQIIQNLKSIVTDIENVQILTENNRVVLSLVFPDYGIPIWLAGDGIVSLFRLCVDLAALPDGVVLMEEPETHLHPGAVWQSAQVIWAAVRDGVQIILSTHSLEFVDALIAKSKDEDELQKMSVYRTQLKNGNLETRCLPGPDVQFKRSEIGDDLR